MTISARINGLKYIFAAVLNGFLGGLLGVGTTIRAVSRTVSARESIILGRVMGLVIVLAAWMFRTKVISLELLRPHLDVILALMAGSLGGAWCAMEKDKKKNWLFLDRVVLVILPAFGLVMLTQAMLGDREIARLSASVASGATAGLLAGFCIGFTTTALDGMGASLLLPAIVVLFRIDSKIAGSLALTILVPTMLLGLSQFSSAAIMQLFREEKRECLLIGCSALAGAALGAFILNFMTSLLILKTMLIFIFYLAFIQFFSFFTKYLRHQR